jgi:hypothetical protein
MRSELVAAQSQTMRICIVHMEGMYLRFGRLEVKHFLAPFSLFRKKRGTAPGSGDRSFLKPLARKGLSLYHSAAPDRRTSAGSPRLPTLFTDSVCL